MDGCYDGTYRFVYSLPKIMDSPFVYDKSIDRIDYSELPLDLQIIMDVNTSEGSYALSLLASNYADNDLMSIPASPDQDQYIPAIDIFDHMMEKYKEYFENGRGWKDAEGKLIDRGESKSIYPSGFDPAK